MRKIQDGLLSGVPEQAHSRNSVRCLLCGSFGNSAFNTWNVSNDGPFAKYDHEGIAIYDLVRAWCDASDDENSYTKTADPMLA